MPNPPYLNDWCRETSLSEGTGDIELLGPVATFRAFASLYNPGDTFYYTVKHRAALEAESGIGTLTAGGQIARTTVLESTSGNAVVSFTAGTKDVYISPISAMWPSLQNNEIWQGQTGQPPIATSSPNVANLVATGTVQTQTVNATTVFVSTLSLSGLTQGSVLFAGASGVVSQNNANLNWNNPLGKLTVTGLQIIIGAAVNTVPLTVKAFAGQTTNLFECQTNLSAAVFSVSMTTQNVLIQSSGAAIKGLVIKASPSQSANLTEWQDNTSVVKASIGPSGGLTVASAILATAALATSATSGFTYLPSCAGKPIGVPAAQTGTVPIVVDSTNGQNFIYAGGKWVCVGPTVNTITFGLGIGTPITTGIDKTNEIMTPYAGEIVRARARAKTGPTGADLIFDLNLNGTTIWSTQANRLKIVAGAITGTQSTFNTITFADGDILTIDVDQVGSIIAGQDVSVQLEIRKTG